MRLEIEVTREDIARGVPCHPSGCPIWFAARRALSTALGREVWCRVERCFVGVGRDEPYAHASLPLPARDFIRDFDSGEDVQPITFQLTIERKDW